MIKHHNAGGNMNIICNILGHKMETQRVTTEEHGNFKTTTFYKRCERCPHQDSYILSSFKLFQVTIPG